MLAQSTNVHKPMLDLMAELMTQVYEIKAHYYKQYKMGRWSFQKMMQCLTVSFHDMFLLVMMRSLSKKFMMKPYPQQNLTADKRVYNYRHSRARRISENLFGILANRWRIFFTTINLQQRHVENKVLSALTLHNMLIKNPA